MSAVVAEVRAPAIAAAPPPCAGCGASSALALAAVSTHAQHLLYAAGQLGVARGLDAALGSGPSSYRMWRCSDCGLEFADPLHAPGESWYAELYGALPLYPGARWEFGVVADALRPGTSLIDYGCGSGEFLRLAGARGASASGVDFSTRAVAAARNAGLAAQVLDLGGRRGRDAPTPGDGADHVTAFHVLEHLAEPGALFEFARAVARPATCLWVAVPSDRRASRLHAEHDALDAPPHHLTRWTGPALAALGARHGWHLDSLRYEPLATQTMVWEAARRTVAYRAFQPRWRALEWAGRRAIAAAVWLGGAHRRPAPSGFSMLAAYSPLESS